MCMHAKTMLAKHKPLLHLHTLQVLNKAHYSSMHAILMLGKSLAILHISIQKHSAACHNLLHGSQDCNVGAEFENVEAASSSQQLSHALPVRSQVQLTLPILLIAPPKTPGNRRASQQRVPRSRDAAALDERAAGRSCSGHAPRPQGRNVRNLQMAPWFCCLMRVSKTNSHHNVHSLPAHRRHAHTQHKYQ